MKIEELNKKDEQDWNNFVEVHPNSTIYHKIEWKQVLEATYKYKAHYFLAKNDHNEITGILPLFEVNSFIFGSRLVSLPFSYHAGILSTSNSTANELLDFAINLTIENDMKYLEIKQDVSYLNKNGLDNSMDYVTSVLHLSRNHEDIWKKLNKDKKRGIKKAQGKGLVVRELSNTDELKEFYTMVLETRKMQGVPAYPLSFFENLYKFMKPDLKIFFSYYKDNPIAGGIFQLHKDNILYGYGMNRKDESLLKLYPMNLLIWEAIQWACKNNYNTFDFGTTPIKHETLLYFKSSWGAKNNEVPYYYYLNHMDNPPVFDPTSPKFKIITGIWKKIPMCISKKIDPYLIRHVG